MKTVQAISNALSGSKIIFEEIWENEYLTEHEEVVLDSDTENLFFGMDNKRAAGYIIKNMDMSSKIQLAYIDPPFFTGNKQMMRGQSKKTQVAYNDVWKSKEEYLTSIAVSLRIIHTLLSDTGSLWVHLDRRAVHEVKIIIDEIFGEENFVNEVIWSYKSGGAGKKSFARKHDNLLFYRKSKDFKFFLPKEKSYNRGCKRYAFKDVKEYQDEKGWYTLVNMRDVWEIDMVGRTSRERVGYASQKPELLLERIITSCTEKGDIVCDIYSGSATAAVVAGKTGRKFIAVDNAGQAIDNTVERLINNGISFKIIKHEDDII